MASKVLDEIESEKPQTIRLVQSDWDYVCKRGGNNVCNKAMASVVAMLRRLEGQCLLELTGYFTPEEWMFFTVILNKKYVTSKEELTCRIADTENFKTKNKSSFKDLDIKALLNKIASPHFNAVHVMAVQSRIMDYWDNCMLIDQEAWSRAI